MLMQPKTSTIQSQGSCRHPSSESRVAILHIPLQHSERVEVSQEPHFSSPSLTAICLSAGFPSTANTAAHITSHGALTPPQLSSQLFCFLFAPFLSQQAQSFHSLYPVKAYAVAPGYSAGNPFAPWPCCLWQGYCTLMVKPACCWSSSPAHLPCHSSEICFPSAPIAAAQSHLHSRS